MKLIALNTRDGYRFKKSYDVGEFGIHRPLNGRNFSKREWQLTHRKTGLYVATASLRQPLQQLADKLNQLGNWAFHNPNTNGAQILLEQAKPIVKEFRFGKRSC